MSLLKRIVKAVKEEILREDSFIKGESFEEWFEETLIDDKISILEKSHNKKINQKFVESNLNPDYKLKFKNSDYSFWIECKYRSSLNKGMLDISNAKQINRYKKLKEPVFYLIHLESEFEEDIFLIPFKHIYPKMYKSHYRKFSLNEYPINEFFLKKLER